MTRAVYGRGTGRNKRDGSMGKLEKRFLDEVILPGVSIGEILWWRFEGFALRLAKKSSYTPDFCVMARTGELIFYEVKGNLWLGEGRTKVKVAAETFPLKILGAQWKAKAWVYEDFSA